MYRNILALVAICLFAGALQAQSLTIKLKFFDRGPDDPNWTISKEVYDLFQRELELRGIASTDGQFRFFVSATSFDDGRGPELVGYSLVQASTLSEPVIEAAGKHQIWYAGKPIPEDLEEGKWVREMLTREIVGNHHMIDAVKTFVVPRSELERSIGDFLDQFIDRLECMRSGVCVSG